MDELKKMRFFVDPPYLRECYNALQDEEHGIVIDGERHFYGSVSKTFIDNPVFLALEDHDTFVWDEVRQMSLRLK
jgi:hypothetical protein